MRPLLVLAILLLGLSGAATEPEYSPLFADYFHAADDQGPSLVEIDSATGRSDRLVVAPLQSRSLPIEILRPTNLDDALTVASASPEIDAALAASSNADADADGAANRPELSIGDLCNALYTSAQDNDLPIAFFANLIWQESRLRDDAVSPKGAQGIAQFMPKVALQTGLDDPFDPMQAIPASARLLHTLRTQFRNLGFVAAAYNAGARRVAEWLKHRRGLPRETRGYVVRVTGLSVDAWRKMPVDGDALTFVRRLPCRSLPAFANVEQEHLEQVELEQAKMEEAKAVQGNTKPAAAGQNLRQHAAERKRERPLAPHEARRPSRENHAGKHEAEHAHAARDKRKSA
jgi:hypothetical protein